jgi:hypothetical protein
MRLEDGVVMVQALRRAITANEIKHDAVALRMRQRIPC